MSVKFVELVGRVCAEMGREHPDVGIGRDGLIQHRLIQVSNFAQGPLLGYFRACGPGLHTQMIALAVGSGGVCFRLSTVYCDFLKFHARFSTSQVCVVSGKLEEMGVFGQYGGLVFELFYRADLSQFG
jgi:hypothetical protein